MDKIKEKYLKYKKKYVKRKEEINNQKDLTVGKVETKNVLSEYYYEVDPTGKEQMPGFYNIESDDRSVINKLNTNYSCFCILVKDINKVLTSKQVNPINFLGKTPKQQEG